MEYKVEQVKILGEELELHPFKSVYWKRREVLVIADVHIGKVAHFINGGIPIPEKAAQENIDRLHFLMKHYKPKELIFLGDLFHSTENNEWELFGDFVLGYPQTKISLIMGNHEILDKDNYRKFGIEVYDKQQCYEPFVLTHEPLKSIDKQRFVLSGHIHPGVRMKGRGLQGVRLPCFYFSENNGVLPAFGTFTGKHIIKPGKKDKVFVLAEKSVVDVSV